MRGGFGGGLRGVGMRSGWGMEEVERGGAGEDIREEGDGEGGK